MASNFKYMVWSTINFLFILEFWWYFIKTALNSSLWLVRNSLLVLKMHHTFKSFKTCDTHSSLFADNVNTSNFSWYNRPQSLTDEYFSWLWKGLWKEFNLTCNQTLAKKGLGGHVHAPSGIFEAEKARNPHHSAIYTEMKSLGKSTLSVYNHVLTSDIYLTFYC